MVASRFFRRAPGVDRHRRVAWGIVVCALLVGIGAALSWVTYDYRVRWLASIGRFGGFVTAQAFPLRDSLPALGGSLSNLEAFKLTVDPMARTNADRSIWVNDSLHRISMEYFADKNPFDSVTLMVWSSDSFAASKTFRNRRDVTWDLKRSNKPTDWTEVVGMYASYPKVLTFRSPDSSVRLFDPVEGKVLHVVRGRYRDHRERITPADTSYPAREKGSDLQLLAKGNALAVVNPSTRAVTLRLVSMYPKRWHLIRVSGNSIHIYRRLLQNHLSNVWAYTNPGETYPVILEDTRDPTRFFLLVK